MDAAIWSLVPYQQRPNRFSAGRTQELIGFISKKALRIINSRSKNIRPIGDYSVYAHLNQTNHFIA
jgi:hypothetical protein